ncbi:MAG TPA: S41 family peptidase [Pyrinomonadaceae bacterium]
MERPYSIRFLAVLALMFVQAALVAAQTAAVADFPQVRQDTFDKVWNTVNERHFDATFNGVDWKAVRDAYLPKAKAARSDEEFHNVLRQMLGELKLSHFSIFPPPPSAESEGDGAGSVGLELKWIGDAPVVYRVEKGSPADLAGVRPGFILSVVDGKKVEDRVKPLKESLAKRSTTGMMRRVYQERFVEALISGKPDSKVALEFLDGEDKPIAVELTRVRYDGEMSQPLGNFPKQKVIFASRLLPENIGYIRFNMWVVPQAAKIRAAVREFPGADGIIFDLRGNPGGVGGLAGGVAGLLSDKQVSLGSMSMRTGTMNFLGYPQSEPFLKKIVVLTDHGTGSTSEVFAAGMQEIGRASVVGETSAGAVLPSVFEKLPSGYMFQYAISDYKSPNNVLIEGRGVIPDVKVLTTRESLLAGRDVQLEAAIAEIRKK